MKIEKKHLELLAKVLVKTQPTFRDARVKDEFIKSIVEKNKTFDADRIKICEGLCKKDKDKKSVMVNGAYQFTEKNKDKFIKEFEILKEEEVEIPLKSKDAKTITRIMDESTYRPVFGEAEVIIDDIMSKIK